MGGWSVTPFLQLRLVQPEETVLPPRSREVNPGANPWIFGCVLRCGSLASYFLHGSSRASKEQEGGANRMNLGAASETH